MTMNPVSDPCTGPDDQRPVLSLYLTRARQTWLTAVLASFGDTQDAVADYMTRRHVHGTPNTADCCPVAIMLRRGLDLGHAALNEQRVTNIYGRCDGFAVSDTDVTWLDDDHQGPAWVRIPDPVANFIGAFDAHRYPRLVVASAS